MNKNLLKSLIFPFLLFILVIISFEMSQIFVSQADRVHIVSITSALLVATTLRYGLKVLPSLILGLLYHYVFVTERDIPVALAFSFSYPVLSCLFAYGYNWLIKRLQAHDYTLRATYYISIFGLAYPLMTTWCGIYLAQALNYPFMNSTEFFAYSVLGSSLSQLLLTPLIFLLIGRFSNQDHHSDFFDADKAMRKKNTHSSLYWGWLLMCLITLAVAITAHEPLMINALCLILVPIIGLGVGNFGFIQPYLISTAVSLISAQSAIANYNQNLLEVDSFYSLIAILFAITSLILLLSAQALKNHFSTLNAINKERIDTFTKLANIAQLKQDIPEKGEFILTYIDLSEMSNRLNSLGFDGKAQLIKHLSYFVTEFSDGRSKAYLPPFSQGTLHLSSVTPELNQNLKRLSTKLSQFKFQWQQESFHLIGHKIVCCSLNSRADLDQALATLCTPNSHASHGHDIHWVACHETSQAKLRKLSQIQAAFKEDQFTLVCQPYLNLACENAPTYFEVLVRLKPVTPNQAILTPAEFFPLITEFGLQIDLDKWVIKNTFKTLHANVVSWDDIGRCSINLTAQALNHTDLGEFIQSLAEEFHIPLHKICFEITESAALSNETQAVTTINQLREHGCVIALDDFGTGYASFDYLRRLPIDILKIDGSFVRHITDNKVDYTIVNTISQVAIGMNLTTVAEFVESPQHINILRELHINYAQGYAISKPIPLIKHLQQQCSEDICTF